jgi:hypothetical protein
LKASNAQNNTFKEEKQYIKGKRKDSKVSPQRYTYFDAVVGLVWSIDPESYTGSSIATDRVSHTRQVSGDDTESKTLALQVGGCA